MAAAVQRAMDRWNGRVALVTGASSGIGAAICTSLAQSGMTVVGIARNKEPIQELDSQITSKSGSIKALKCDLTNDKEIEKLFEIIKETYGGPDICINNAGMSYSNSLMDGTPEEWHKMLGVNVVSLCYCTKLAVTSMEERGVSDGQIINISSLAGHLNATSSHVHFYAATKHAVRSLTESFRLEMRDRKRHIRVASISPGLVDTDFHARQFGPNDDRLKILSRMQALQAKDIADAVLYILSSPQHVEVNDIIIRPTEQKK